MTQMHHSPTRIVFVGGGYVTLYGYRALMRATAWGLGRRPPFQVTVIAPNSSHHFHGWTGETLEGIISPINRLTPLRKAMPQAHVVRGHATRVDLEQQHVEVRLFGTMQREYVAYDHLVLGAGSKEANTSIPGLSEHGFALKGPGDTLRFRNHVLRMFERADATSNVRLREQLLTFVIAGGGFAGVELCAAMAGLIRASRKEYRCLRRNSVRLILAHVGEDLLPSLRPDFDRMADYATEQLIAQGIDLRLLNGLASVEPNAAILSDGSRIPTFTVLATRGQQPIQLPGTEALERSADGRVLAEPELRASGQSAVWVGGDNASVTHPIEGIPCPANALWAIKHGECIGRNLGRLLTGAPLKPFRFPGLGQAASVGIGKGLTELYGMQFTGVTAWMLRMMLFHHFMPSKTQAARVALDWVTAPLLGRYSSPVETMDEADFFTGVSEVDEELLAASSTAESLASE